MPFKIGDLVVYPAYGTGHIDDVKEKEYSGEGTHPYYKVTQPKHTMWVRVEAREATGPRMITARSELDHYRDVLKSLPTWSWLEPLNQADTTTLQKTQESRASIKNGRWRPGYLPPRRAEKSMPCCWQTGPPTWD